MRPGLADPTLAQAIADLNGSGAKNLPRMGYAGFTWDNFIHNGTGKIVEANVRPESQQLCRDGRHGEKGCRWEACKNAKPAQVQHWGSLGECRQNGHLPLAGVPPPV